MPKNVKLGLSVVVALVAIGVHLFQRDLGQDLNSWLVLALGAFMIFAMWLFPEAQKAKKDSER